MFFWIFETVQVEKLRLEEKITKSLTKSREPGQDPEETEPRTPGTPGTSSTTEDNELTMKNFNEIEREDEDSDDENQFIPNTAKLKLMTR